jgi:ribosomal protein S18 acetylase RimI-like enzyme
VREDHPVRGPPITLRPAAAADESLLWTLFATERRAQMTTSGLEKQVAEQLLELQYRAQRRQYQADFPAADSAVIEIGGVPSGRLLVERRPGEIRVVDIALLQGSRGRGVGAVLLRQIQDEAAQAGYRVVLQVARDNAARRLYDRLGFTESAGDDVYLVMVWEARAPGLAPIETQETRGAAA